MLMTSYYAGYTAGLDGKLPMANPYGRDSFMGSLWRKGWKDGRKIRRAIQ